MKLPTQRPSGRHVAGVADTKRAGEALCGGVLPPIDATAAQKLAAPRRTSCVLPAGSVPGCLPAAANVDRIEGAPPW